MAKDISKEVQASGIYRKNLPITLPLQVQPFYVLAHPGQDSTELVLIITQDHDIIHIAIIILYSEHFLYIVVEIGQVDIRQGLR